MDGMRVRFGANRQKKGTKQRIVLYWKRIMREFGVNWMDVERLFGNRNGWEQCGREDETSV